MFGQRLRRFREGRRLSQDELADRIGKARRTVGRWERGETSPSLDDLILISGALGVGVDVLAGHEPLADHDLSIGVTPENVQGGSTDGQDPKNDTGPEDAGKRLTSGPGHEEHTDESVGAVLEAAGHAR